MLRVHEAEQAAGLLSERVVACYKTRVQTVLPETAGRTVSGGQVVALSSAMEGALCSAPSLHAVMISTPVRHETDDYAAFARAIVMGFDHTCSALSYGAASPQGLFSGLRCFPSSERAVTSD